MGPRPRGLNLVYFSVECGVCWTVPCTTPHSGDDGLGEPPQSMEWRNGIVWTPPLTYVVDLWLSLVGGNSTIARLTLTDCLNLFSRPVAATGRRPLRPRPVDFDILFLLNLWLSLVGGNSTFARLNLLYLTELLCDYFILMYILWTNICCCLMAENKI